MTIMIPDLWSDDIKVSVLPPIAVLKAQEGLLASKTEGMLRAELTTTQTDNLVQHQLDLIAPSLDYRERLLSAKHDRDRVYPVLVTAAAFAPRPLAHLEIPQGAPDREKLPARTTQREAATAEDFIGLVKEVLHSVEVRSLIQSLIARINEPKPPETEAQPPASEGDGAESEG